MSSSNSAPEKSEQQRIWQLEEQLDDEQYAHRKTKFTLREVQEKLEQLSIGKDSNTPKDDRVENLITENEDLKNTLKMREERLEDLEKENRNLRFEMSSLEKSNEECTESMKKLNNELAKMKTQNENSTKEEIQDLVKLNKELMESLKEELKVQLEKQSNKATMNAKQIIEDLRQVYSVLEKPHKEIVELMQILEAERDELKVQLEEQLEKEKGFEKRIEDLERLNKKVADSVEVLKSERDAMKIQLEEQSDKLKDYETRLGEYREEVDRLKFAKLKMIENCQTWVSGYRMVAKRLAAVLNQRGWPEDAEEVENLRKHLNAAQGEYKWLYVYNAFTESISFMFETTQKLRTSPNPEELIPEDGYVFVPLMQTIKKRRAAHAWIHEHEKISLKYFENLKKVAKEVEERIKKP